MSVPVKKQRSRSSSSVKLVVDKPVIDKFATQYASINHLNKYPVVMRWINTILCLPLVSRVLSTISLIVFQFKTKVIDSGKTPAVVKKLFNYSVARLKKLDEFVNTMVFREGIDAFLNEYREHGSLGWWIAYFTVDYYANLVNYLVKEFILKPLSLIKDDASSRVSLAAASSSTALPHFKELTNTTKDVLEPTKEKVFAKYDTLVKPAKETYTHAISTAKETYSTAYKTVSEKYDTNLKETDSVPRAILTTGSDLGSLTLERLKKYNDSEENSVVADGTTTTVDSDPPVNNIKELST